MRTVTCALVTLVSVVAACGDKAPSPTGDASTTTSTKLRSEAGILWERATGTLVAYGLPSGSVSERLQELATALGVKDLTIARPGRPATTDAALTAMLEPILRLERARLVLTDKAVELRGHTRRARRKAAAEAAAREVIPGATVAVDITMDGASLRPDEGRLELVGFDKPIEDMAPRPILAGADALGPEVDPAGDPWVDEQGRIAEGLYQLADGTSVGVVRGRKTVVKAGAPAIVVGGRRFVLDDDVPLVALDAPDALSFAVKDKGPDEMPTYGPRYERPGVRVKDEDLPHARRVVRSITLHADLVDESRNGFDNLVARSLSSHFLIDFDGKVYQTLDPIACAYHAGEMNNQTIGVDLNNRQRNLAREPDEPPYDPKHARYAEMEKHPRAAPMKLTIQGVEVEAHGYTEAQYRSLAALTRRLADIFPPIAEGAPKDADGKVPLVALPPERWRGVLGHLHGEAQRWDPGPFDWARIDQALAERAVGAAATPPPAAALPPLDAGAAPTATTPAKVRAAWSRVDGALSVTRAEHGGAVVQGARAKATALGATTFSLVEPALPDLPDATLTALFDALLALKEGALEVDGKTARVSGRAHTSKDAEAVKQAAARADGVKVTVEVEVDAVTMLPGEGRLEARGGPLPVVKRLSDQQVVTPDEHGRVPPGTYTLADGSLAIVVEGRTTGVAIGAAPIVVGGRRFLLDRPEVRVVAPGEPAALMVIPGARRVEGDDLEALRQAVDAVVITSDFAADARAGVASLDKLGVSPHFVVDFDGTVFETLDPETLGRLDDAVDGRAIVIALSHTMDNLELTPDAPAYPAGHSRAVEMRKHPRPEAQRGEVNGAKVRMHGYTEAQFVALGSLLRRLGEIFPKLGAGMPRDPSGAVRNRTLDERPVGVLAHWHLDAETWAPGPGLDWVRVTQELGGGPIEEVAGPEAARRIAARFLRPGVDRAVLLERLRPRREDCDAIFQSEARESCNLAAVRGSWARTAKDVLGPLSGPITMDAVGAVQLGDDEIGHFSDTVLRLKGLLPEGVVLYRAAFGPGGADAPALEGLVFANGRWVFLAEPGKLVPKDP